METQHKIVFENTNKIKIIENESINLIVTSPPYPMIEMWDEIFINQNKNIGKAYNSNNVNEAFELMHNILDKIWIKCYDILCPGGILCINIGDATRTFNNNFQLFSSHSRILHKCIDIGFQNLPNIIWRKQTNAPNKYMGSGMLPPGAYVTLEHEYILIFRKGNKREFRSEQEKEIRSNCSYFWEERNEWFSDVWVDLKGTKQNLNNNDLRKRSGAYPLELALRLVSMFSIYGDYVLDPFLGTGTTTLASIILGRNSIGIEIDNKFHPIITKLIKESKQQSAAIIQKRIIDHLNFVIDEKNKGRTFKNHNRYYRFPCISKQEENLIFYLINNIKELDSNNYKIEYLPFQKDYGSINQMVSLKSQNIKRDYVKYNLFEE